MGAVKVMVGLSGGVDSSVAALRLQEQGYDVEALFMKNWEEDDTAEYCSAAQDLADAQQVADRLGIHLHAVNFATEYWDRVFEYFLAEYRAGRTPNPDILCNKEIKFRAFLEFAQDLGAEKIATGHYARLGESSDGLAQLLVGLDDNKDQSYFLYALQQDQLQHALFPVGDLPKATVREMAKKANFVTAKKKDSTGICFIGERKFSDFLARFLPAQPGDIMSDRGETLGQHNGLMFYTLGQRQGLGIGGQKQATESPWYVLDKLLESNVLLVGQGHDHPKLFHDVALASQATWVSGEPPAQVFDAQAKVRYRQTSQPCRVHVGLNGAVEVEFDQPQRAMTPGQSLVFYDEEVCLGGAVIDGMEQSVKHAAQCFSIGGK